jgi:transcriptional regulator with XRE-family HTH domain
MITKDILIKIKCEKNLTSDGQLAKKIGCSRQDVSHWMNGRNLPSPYWTAKIADAADMTLEEVTALVQLEKEKNPEKREYWNRLLSGAAIVILSVAANMGLMPVDSSIMLSNELTEVVIFDDNNRHYAQLVIMALFLLWTIFQQQKKGKLTHELLEL